MSDVQHVAVASAVPFAALNGTEHLAARAGSRRILVWGHHTRAQYRTPRRQVAILPADKGIADTGIADVGIADMGIADSTAQYTNSSRTGRACTLTCRRESRPRHTPPAYARSVPDIL
eukprot:3931975-Rhodomonas_salina.1